MAVGVSHGLVANVGGTLLAVPSTWPGKGQPSVTSGGCVSGGRREDSGSRAQTSLARAGPGGGPQRRAARFHGDLYARLCSSAIGQIQQWPWGNRQGFTSSSQPLLCLCGERRGSFQRHQFKGPLRPNTHIQPHSPSTRAGSLGPCSARERT